MRDNPQKRFATSPLLKVFLIMLIGYVLTSAVGLLVQLPLAIVQQMIMVRAAAEGQAADPFALMSRMMLFQVPASFLNMLAATAVQHLHVVRADAVLLRPAAPAGGRPTSKPPCRR